MTIFPRIASVLLAVMVVSGTFALAEARTALGATTSACNASGESEYLAPIKKLRPVRKLPNRPPFAPRVVSTQTLNALRVGPGGIGLLVSNTANGQPIDLNWTIKARLSQIDKRGRPSTHASAQQRKVMIRSLPGGASRVVSFKVQGQPSYYRIDFVLRDSAGKVLGKYGEYYRVVQPAYASEMWLGAVEVSSGEALSAKLRNLGTESVLLGSQMEIQRLSGSEWTQVGVASVGQTRPGFRVVVPGGTSADCARFRIPDGQAAGTYRIAGQVTHDGIADVVSAEFQVK